MRAHPSICCLAALQAPEGMVPDVVTQIPGFVRQRVLSRFDVIASGASAMRGVLRLALDVACQAQAEQQQLRQQVAGLQASMDAVLRHLQLPSVGGVGGEQEAEQQE